MFWGANAPRAPASLAPPPKHRASTPARCAGAHRTARVVDPTQTKPSPSDRRARRYRAGAGGFEDGAGAIGDAFAGGEEVLRADDDGAFDGDADAFERRE